MVINVSVQLPPIQNENFVPDSQNHPHVPLPCKGDTSSQVTVPDSQDSQSSWGKHWEDNLLDEFDEDLLESDLIRQEILPQVNGLHIVHIA